jgi:hypothetical protein
MKDDPTSQRLVLPEGPGSQYLIRALRSNHQVGKRSHRVSPIIVRARFALAGVPQSLGQFVRKLSQPYSDISDPLKKFEGMLFPMLGRVDGFDQDEAEGEGDEGTVIARSLLATKGDALEALEFADGLLDARPRFALAGVP